MKFEGCYTALVTPFSADGSLDEGALRGLVRRQVRAGISGLVPCGSTGEAATLTHEEFRRVIKITLEEAAGRCPVIAGVSANDTAKAAALCREAEELGAQALLVLAPYYNKPGQEGLYRHFRSAAQSTSLPVVVYNIPGRTAVNLQPKTLARLAADCPNIAAIKEASGSLDQVSEILTLLPKSFSVLSGDDSLTLPMLAAGARGVVSVLSNAAPAAVLSLCRAWDEGNAAKARRLHLRAYPLVKALFLETNPIPIKAALEMMGLCRQTLRLPLTPLESANRARLRRELRNFGLVE